MRSSINDLLKIWDLDREGADLHALVSELYPFCRSITGDGLRRSLHTIERIVPLSLFEIPTGTKAFDWSVPKEWNIRDAWIKDSKGLKVVDFKQCNLHAVNYSVPIRRKMGLDELRKHLFTLPDSPDWIPYRTSYYKETWGFCLTQRQADALKDDEYEVCIDSSLESGHLTYGQFRIQGETDYEILISAHSCHPSLCNDNLSGMAVAAKLAQCLRELPLRYSYRFLWIPATIGTIAWLASHERVLPRIKHGLILSCVGDSGPFTYKRSRHGDAEIDRVVEHMLKSRNARCSLLDFTPHGYDERQYCSPGINLPVGCFMRTPNGKYAEYHTSADNLDFVKPLALAESVHMLLSIFRTLEENHRYMNLNPMCEPQLGSRGLYRLMGGTSSNGFEEALLWLLNFSDGQHSLLDIAERSQVPFDKLAETAKVLIDHDLLRKEAPQSKEKSSAKALEVIS